MNNAEYTRAIDILMSEQIDFRSMTIELAKEDPALFNQLFTRLEISCELGWVGTVISLIRGNNFVESIKTVRQETGLGLKDAKDVCDRFRVKLIELGMATGLDPYGYGPYGELEPGTARVLLQEMIVEAKRLRDAAPMSNSPSRSAQTLGELLRKRLNTGD